MRPKQEFTLPKRDRLILLLGYLGDLKKLGCIESLVDFTVLKRQHHLNYALRYWE